MNSAKVIISFFVLLTIAECSSENHFGELSVKSDSSQFLVQRSNYENKSVSRTRRKRAAQRRRPLASSGSNGSRVPPRSPPLRSPPRPPVRPQTRRPIPAPTWLLRRTSTRPPQKKPPVRPQTRRPIPEPTWLLRRTSTRPPQAKPPTRRQTILPSPRPLLPTTRPPTRPPIRPPTRPPTTPKKRAPTRSPTWSQKWQTPTTMKPFLQIYRVIPTISPSRTFFTYKPSPVIRISTEPIIKVAAQTVPTSVNVMKDWKQDVKLHFLPEESAIGAGIKYHNIDGYGLSLDGKRTNSNVRSIGVNGHLDVFTSQDRKTNVELVAGATKTIGGKTQGTAELVVRQYLR